MEFTLYTAALTGAEANCRYPEQRKISCAEDLEQRLRLTMSVRHSKMITGNGRIFSHPTSWSWTAIIHIRKILLNG
jgi:hypothetical protein